MLLNQLEINVKNTNSDYINADIALKNNMVRIDDINDFIDNVKQSAKKHYITFDVYQSIKASNSERLSFYFAERKKLKADKQEKYNLYNDAKIALNESLAKSGKLNRKEEFLLLLDKLDSKDKLLLKEFRNII